ncbi:MAG: hypothetical protein IT462_05620 [Planctomycetes bacterium]|nr:hypothetical protein [Planctomycetota bacterium]
METNQPNEELEPKLSYEERRKALLAKADEELEEFARHGVVSPAALKAAKWISRGLWLGMSVLVVILLVRQGDMVAKSNYDRAVADLKAKSKAAADSEKLLDEIRGLILVEGFESGTLDNARADKLGDATRALLESGRKARSDLREAQLEQVRLATETARLRPAHTPPAERWEAYKAAKPEEKLMALAWALEVSGAGEREKVAEVAVSSRPAPERVIAIRWKGGKGDETWNKVLKGLSEGKGLVAEEAQAALK